MKKNVLYLAAFLCTSVFQCHGMWEWLRPSKEEINEVEVKTLDRLVTESRELVTRSQVIDDFMGENPKHLGVAECSLQSLRVRLLDMTDVEYDAFVLPLRRNSSRNSKTGNLIIFLLRMCEYESEQCRTQSQEHGFERERFNQKKRREKQCFGIIGVIATTFTAGGAALITAWLSSLF